MAVNQIDRLRVLFGESMSVRSDKVRLLHQWPDPAAWTPWLTGDPAFDNWIRWRPRNLAVVVGDEGSGKSTFSQILSMKLLTGPQLLNTDATISVCAWEDDRSVFRDMLFRFDPLLERRTHWFEPDADPERLLDDYIFHVEELSKDDNCVLHVVDPWNAFNHDWNGDVETRYTQKMLNAMERLTRSLGNSMIVVTHLPKRPGRGLRPFGISDSAGSKAFANAASMGFCISNTHLLAELQDMSEADLKTLKLTPDDVFDAIKKHGQMLGPEHMIAVTDKVKVRRPLDDPKSMGVKAVKAFVLDRERFDLKLDATATELARKLWVRL
jgi:hypothetical protein